MTDSIALSVAVSPDPLFAQALADPQTRLDQYRAALQKWTHVASKTDSLLLIVETSHWELRDLTAELSPHDLKRVRAVSYTPSEAERIRGKGAIEASAIDHLLHSCSSDLSPRDTVVKVTGRLFVSNWRSVIRPVPEDVVRARRTINRSYCDSRLVAASYRFWTDNLTGMGREVDDNSARYLEHVLANRLINAEYQHACRVESFAARPHIMGGSGTTGHKYDSSLLGLVSKPIQFVEGWIDKKVGLKKI